MTLRSGRAPPDDLFEELQAEEAIERATRIGAADRPNASRSMGSQPWEGWDSGFHKIILSPNDACKIPAVCRLPTQLVTSYQLPVRIKWSALETPGFKGPDPLIRH